MKIMTFNTQHCENFITKKIDFELFAETIKKYDPDIVALNEIRGKGARADYQAQTEILAELTQMPYFYFAKAIDVAGENPYGNAILSKIPLQNVETVPIPDPEDKTDGGYYETRCVLKAFLSNGCTVLVTHFGLNLSEQINAVNTVLGSLESEKCVLMGDFNVTPESSILDPIRAVLKDTQDFMDGQEFTFRSDDPTVKIDYIFTTKDVKITSVKVAPDVVSDHFPIIAEILL